MNGKAYGKMRWGRSVSTPTMLSVLGGGARLEIVRTLARMPLAVKLLAQAIDLDISAVSHELRILREYGLVRCEAMGTSRIYRLSCRIKAVQRRERLWLTVWTDERELVRLALRTDK